MPARFLQGLTGEQFRAAAERLSESVILWCFPQAAASFGSLWPMLADRAPQLLSGSGQGGSELTRLDGLAAIPTEPAAGCHLAVLTVWATLTECGRRGVIPRVEEIRESIETVASRFGASKPMAASIAAAVAPDLVDLLARAGGDQLSPGSGAVSAPPIPSDSDQPTATDRVRVAWYDRWADERDPLSVRVEVEHGPRQDILDRFDARSGDFALYVNELGPIRFRRIDPAGGLEPGEPVALAWSELRPQAARFLWLVLQAFEKRRGINYHLIRKFVFEKRSPSMGLVPEGSVRRVVSQLNSKLGGILTYALYAARSGETYGLRAQFPYCWIAPVDQASRLTF